MDILITLWQEFIKENEIQFEKPPLDRETVQRIADSIDIDVNKDYVVDFIINRYEKI